jgi:hypothetical protein
MGRTIVVLLAAVLVGLGVYSKYWSGSGQSGDGALRVVYAYSSNQEDLLLPLIEQFNAERHEAAGRRIEIVGQSISSGDAEAKLAANRLPATLWSPASSLWGRLLDYAVDARWFVTRTHRSSARRSSSRCGSRRPRRLDGRGGRSASRRSSGSRRASVAGPHTGCRPSGASSSVTPIPTSLALVSPS